MGPGLDGHRRPARRDRPPAAGHWSIWSCTVMAKPVIDAGPLCGVAPGRGDGHSGPCAAAGREPTWSSMRPARTCGRWRPIEDMVPSAGGQERRVLFGGAAGISRSRRRRLHRPAAASAALEGECVLFHYRHRHWFRQRCSTAGPYRCVADHRIGAGHGDVQLRDISRTGPRCTRSSDSASRRNSPRFAAMPGVFTFGWGPVLHQLAAGLGVKIDNIERSNERYRRPSLSTRPPATSRPGRSRRCGRP